MEAVSEEIVSAGRRDGLRVEDVTKARDTTSGSEAAASEGPGGLNHFSARLGGFSRSCLEEYNHWSQLETLSRDGWLARKP